MIRKIAMTHIIQNISPTLESDTLEDSQHTQAEVVEICYPRIRTLPEQFADHAFLAYVSVFSTRMRIFHQFV